MRGNRTAMAPNTEPVQNASSADTSMVDRGSATPESREPVLCVMNWPVCRSPHTEPRPHESMRMTDTLSISEKRREEMAQGADRR